MIHNVSWISAGESGETPEGGITLKTAEDATKILLETAQAVCKGKPPRDFNTRARVLAECITVLTSTILRSAAAAVQGGANPHDIAGSGAFASNLLCQAAADLLTHDVERLVSEKSHPEFSAN